MNIKTIFILLVLAIIIFMSLKSLWKYLKGEKSCGCSGNSCCSGKAYKNSKGNCIFKN